MLVRKYFFESLGLDHDYEEAQRILNSGHVTEVYDAYSVYAFRDVEGRPFIGTYELTLERREDYTEFIRMLSLDLSRQGKAVDFSITYEEWREGKKQVDEKRAMRLNKFLKRNGASQVVLDFYSRQVKTEKTIYVTVSDLIQHVAGMSYYSSGEWDGISGSSCQDPRNGYSECERLIGSLADTRLFVVFMHERLEDLENMNGKMLARTMARLITVDGKHYLIATRRYGNNTTIDELSNALKQLESYGIYDRHNIPFEPLEEHEEQGNFQAYTSYYETIYVEHDEWTWINYECPVCYGTGEYTVYDRFEYSHIVECPHCEGRGEIEDEILVEFTKEVEIKEEVVIKPYDEDYNHYGDWIVIDIPLDYMKKNGSHIEMELLNEKMLVENDEKLA